MTEKTEKKALSKRELRDLAQTAPLGLELLKEIERLQKKGVRLYNSDTAKGHHPARVALFLRGQEEPSAHELADGIDTPSLRAQALASAKSDRGFLKVRLEDLDHWREPSEHGNGDNVYVDGWDGTLLSALARQLDYSQTNRNACGFYRIDERTDWGGTNSRFLLDHDFERRLKEQKLNWLDLLRSKDKSLREDVAKCLGDASDPEEVVISLIERRMDRLENEIMRTLDAQRQEQERREKREAEHSASNQIDDAWGNFFSEPGLDGGGGQSTEGAPALPDVEQAPVHPRGVAPQLGDAGLTRD